MKNLKYLLITIILVSACGGGSEDKQTQFYKKEQTTPQKLEVSIDASGVIEAISSVEIKSKASGEVLFLGAEVGDFIDKGFMLAQIDQRTANNIVDQTKSDLEASKVRLLNAESQFERGQELHANASISDKDFEYYLLNLKIISKIEPKDKLSIDDDNGLMIEKPYYFQWASRYMYNNSRFRTIQYINSS